MNEEEIFQKPPPKKKRVLTEKQKEALAKGRARVRENKKAKDKTSVELKTEQREEKKKLTKKQQEALEVVKKTEFKKKKNDEWDDKKSKILATMPDEKSFNLLNNYLDTIKEEDVLDDKLLRKRIGQMAKHLHDRTL